MRQVHFSNLQPLKIWFLAAMTIVAIWPLKPLQLIKMRFKIVLRLHSHTEFRFSCLRVENLSLSLWPSPRKVYFDSLYLIHPQIVHGTCAHHVNYMKSELRVSSFGIPGILFFSSKLTFDFPSKKYGLFLSTVAHCRKLGCSWQLGTKVVTAT